MSKDRRISGPIVRGEPFQITVDGKPVTAYAGETIATVLLASGFRIFRHTARQGEPRSVFCGIGICYDCLVTVNNVPNQRACMTFAKPGLAVIRQRGTVEKDVSSE
jgi:predicted molibdopterin-dependent oxidoreductase YjgC